MGTTLGADGRCWWVSQAGDCQGRPYCFKNRASCFLTWTLDLGFEGWIGVFQIEKGKAF